MLENYTANLSPENTKIELRILEVDPTMVDLIVKVQEELNYSPGILREGTDTYTLAGRDKRRGENMRDSTITYYDHISRFEENDPHKRKALGFVGNGNLLMNQWFVAWVDGKLFHVKDEPVFVREEPYSSLVIWKDRRVTIENLWFRGGRIKADDPIQGRDITEEVIYTTYGQRLVERGRFIQPAKIRDQYYDIRHLLLFPFFKEEGYFGLNEEVEGVKNENRREQALKKRPVELDFKGDEAKLKMALSEKQYQEALRVTKEGQYRISGGQIRIVFKSGIFPHNMIAVAENGKVLSILATGRSNTAGLMLDKADGLFEDVKSRYGIEVEDAVLLDNGGDVMMYCRGEGENGMVVKSFNSRDKLRSVILFVGDPDSRGVRLV